MGGFFSPATLEQIRAASDIVDVIGGYIPLKKNGANFVALCPFHREKTPSFNVNPHKQIFHCFGCHKGGDVFTFVKEYENMDFPDAVRRLAERARIPLEIGEVRRAGPTRGISRSNSSKSTSRSRSAGKRPWPRGRPAPIARDYLARRGVSAEAVQLFRLGYALGRLGRHGQMGQKQELRIAARRTGGPDGAQGRFGPLLRPLPRAAHLPNLRRTGPRGGLQRTGA
jgi:DNA primase